MQPSHLPHESPQHRIKAIGHVLVTRRTAMDPARHRKRDGWVETVRAVTGMDKPKRTIIDLETGARVPDSEKRSLGYDTGTLAAMEKAYRLRIGSLGDALQGGKLVADDGQVLYPPPASTSAGPVPEGSVTERHRDEITSRVVSIVRDLETSAKDMPEKAAWEMLQHALDAARDQARLVAESYRRGHAHPRPKEVAEDDHEE